MGHSDYNRGLKALKYIVYFGFVIYFLQIPQMLALPPSIAFIFLTLSLFFQIFKCMKERKEKQVHKDTLFFTLLLGICYIFATINHFIK